MLEQSIPDLTLPGMTYGKHEVPRDLRRWLFKGGAATNARKVEASIKSGELGRAVAERLALVLSIHEVISNHVDGGGPRSTAIAQIERTNQFFIWADESGEEVSLSSIEADYRHWTDSLVHRALVDGTLSEKVAYEYGNLVGAIVDRIAGRATPIVRTTRLVSPRQGSRAVSYQGDKQNLEATFALGHFLLDIADGLSVETIWGTLPVRIRLRNGKELEEWAGHSRAPRISSHPKYLVHAAQYANRAAKNLAAWQAEHSFRTRYPLINLRIQAEMFMLMGQPAVNLAQAHQLRMDQWRYKPSTNGYEIRTYKNRRWGPVVFEIYSEYRRVFERYLKWRAIIFPDVPDGLLFPLLGKQGWIASSSMAG